MRTDLARIPKLGAPDSLETGLLEVFHSLGARLEHAAVSFVRVRLSHGLLQFMGAAAALLPPL